MATLRTPFLGLLAGAAVVFSGFAWPSLTPTVGEGQTYRDRLIAQAAREHGLEPELAPTGKRIERLVLVRLDVILDEDPLPSFLNAVHVKTREETLTDELLIAQGDLWTDARVEETERNLRSNLYVTLADVSAWKGSTPDSVVALVLIKDLWSLRPGIRFTWVGTGLQSLELQMSEQNLLGRRMSVGFDFGLDPYVLTLGGQFRDQRVLRSRWTFQARTDLLINRTTGAFEGEIAGFALERPLFSLGTEWAWGVNLDVKREVFRLYRSLESYAEVEVPQSTGESIPLDYRRNRWEGRAYVTRSLGAGGSGPDAWKKNLTLGWKGQFREHQLYRTDFSATGLGEFSQAYLPRTERNSLLFANVRVFTGVFEQAIDIDRFTVTEDILLGPDLEVETRVASSALGFDSNFWENQARLSYAHRLGEATSTREAYAFVTLTGSARYQPELSLEPAWVNLVWGAQLRFVSPRLGPVRLHLAARLSRRELDQDKGLEVLGGDASLRGYSRAAFFGLQGWGANAEVRTIPISIATAQFGAVTFADVGDAAFSGAGLRAHGSAGFGVRMSFPQFTRSLLRVDVAFPLESTPYATYVVGTFGQAF